MTRYFTLAILLGLAACKDQPVKVKTVVQEVKPDTPVEQTQVTLTEKLIDNTADEDLVNHVLYYLETNVPEDAAKDLPVASARNKSRQAIYLISLIQAEVENGGFNQFYYNQRHLTIKHLPEAFKIIGTERYAALMKKANDIYEKHYKQIKKSQDGTVDDFIKSYENNPFSELDDIFYDLSDTEDLDKLLAKYIREHKADFTRQ
jgi:hypothetical protein